MDQGHVGALRASLSPRYRLEGIVGEGGMATVYGAQDVEADRRVAVKVLRPELAAFGSPRFLREIELTKQLAHPNIVPILDHGRAGPLPYFVMPFVDAPTLRERLRAEGPLPLDEAVDVALHVADALRAAHARGVVHRDIKPSNVFVSESRAVVSDFGVARWVEAAGADRLTESGIAVGTPGYMSPEQFGAEKHLDARSDIYSLGCVLYEMLTGEPPFTGPTRAAIYAKQASLAPPSPVTLRETVPPAVDEAVRRALARSPADRFPSIEAFADELERARHDRRTSAAARRRAPRPAVAAAAVLGLTTIAGAGWWATHGDSHPVPDADRYVVFPFEHAPEAGAGVRDGQVRDALSRWSDISVVDARRLDERLGASDPAGLSPSAAGRIARSLGAAWYVRGRISPIGDSLRVQANLVPSSGDPSAGREGVVRIAAASDAVPDSALAMLLDGLLLGAAPPSGLERGTASLSAQRAFQAGEQALLRWDLRRADSLFSVATDLDPAFARAHLWAAVVRWWDGQPLAHWTVSVEQAGLGAAKLPAREGSIAEAMADLARDDGTATCGAWEELAGAFPTDFAAWYGTATCLARDRTVVRDAGSPSGWSFRSSYQHALRAYRRAFRLQPAVLASFSRDSWAPLLGLLQASGNDRRAGRAHAPDGGRFVADPSWEGDSLAFVPYPMGEGSTRLTTTPPRLFAAIQGQREAFRDIVTWWVRDAPGSAEARRAQAVALAMLGEPTALDTLRLARTLAGSEEKMRSLRRSEVWLLLATALPHDPRGVRLAKARADSVVAEGDPDAPWATAGVAALTGRALRAAELASGPGVAEELGAPGPLAGAAPRLLVLAALGGPADSLRVLESAVAAIIEAQVPPPEREDAIRRWIVRPATLAFPDHRFGAYADVEAPHDYLWTLQAHFDAGRTHEVREGLESLRAMRDQIFPAALTFDALLPEATLLTQLGENEAAAAWLDPTLRSLARVAPHALERPPAAASLVRAMALRARVAAEAGDPATAAAWASAVAELWTDADPFLQPLVQEMAGIAGKARRPQ